MTYIIPDSPIESIVFMVFVAMTVAMYIIVVSPLL